MHSDEENQTDIEQRRRDLTKVLENIQEKDHVKNKEKNSFHMPAEFISPIIVGICLGLFIDSQLGISPICLIVLLFLGFFVGIINIVRIVGHKEYSFVKKNKEK